MATRLITNIVGPTARSSLAKLGEAYTLNMFEETTNPGQELVEKILRPIPGYRKVCDITGQCRGMFTCSNGYNGSPVTYAVFDTSVYVILSGNRVPFKIGEVAQGSSPVHFAETGNREGFHSHLVIVDGNYCYAVDTQVKPANQKEDFSVIQLPYRDFEQGITIHPTHIAYLYGYILVSDAGTDSFFISYQFPFERNGANGKLDKNIFQVGSEEWGNNGQSLQAYWAPDNTTALVANGSRLYTFGSRSYQMFQYTSDVNVPFNSPDTAAFPIGLKAVDSLCQLGSTVVFLGSSDLGNNGIYVIQGGTNATRVSTPSIEREIATFDTVKDAIAQIWQENQHVFYCITFPSAGRTLCYDITEQSWSDRCSLADDNRRVAWRYQFATMNYAGKIWQAFNGGIAEQVDDYWMEHDGNPILRLRRGGVIQSNHQHFFIDYIDVITNNGQYSYLFDGTPAKMMLRFSTDGVTWSDNEVVEIGSVGEYDYDCVFYDFGMGKIFSFELSCTDNIPFAIFGLKMKAGECQF